MLRTERRIAHIYPLHRAVPVDDKCAVEETTGWLAIRRWPEHLVGVCHGVAWVRKDREAEWAELLKPPPGQIRRVGAEGDHPC